MSTMADFNKIQTLLERGVEDGPFDVLVMASSDGLLVASAKRSDTDENVVAALGTLISSTIKQLRDEMGLGGIKKAIVQSDRGNIVFLDITTSDEDFVLVGIVPKGIRYFKKRINEIARNIKKILS
ncbi:MAG: roadblock/LC7 domain-containing protein [Candidatus Asgardarchaeia archaeon]